MRTYFALFKSSHKLASAFLAVEVKKCVERFAITINYCQIIIQWKSEILKQHQLGFDVMLHHGNVIKKIIKRSSNVSFLVGKI